MKRIFVYVIAAAALAFGAASCISNVFPEGTDPTPVLESEGIDINITEITDNSFTFGLLPKGKASYYSYLVTASPAQPDSSLLYAVKYTGLSQGTFSAKKNPRYFITVDELTPDQAYYIYAVAGSLEGNVSSVASVSVRTTDGVAPEIASFSYKGNVVTLTFSEPVSYVEGKEISAQGFAFLYPLSAPTVEKAVGEVAVKGNVATVTFADITQPGTLYVVNIPAGAFKDSVGQLTEGVTSAIEGQDAKGNPVFTEGSIYGYVSAGEIEVESDLAPETLVNYKDAVTLFKCETPISQLAEDAVVAIVVHEGDGVKTTTEYSLTLNETYGATDDYTVVAFLPQEPARGDLVSFVVEEGAAIDIYGNTSPALTIGPILYSYGLTLADAIGVYPASGETALKGKENDPDWDLVLAESDDPEQGNIMIAEYQGIPCAIYGEFDGDAGTLSVDMDYAPVGLKRATVSGVDCLLDYYTISYFVDLAGTSNGPVVFQFTAPGVISSVNDYIGWYADAYLWPESGNLEDIDEDEDYLGYLYNIQWNPSFKRTEEEAEVAAPASISLNLTRKVETLDGTLKR